jgi:uncharacterized protein (TIGR02444 family)
VQIACLRLQDCYGADVNITLFLLFQASLGRRLSTACVRDIGLSVAGWRAEVVQPLRTMRRRLKYYPFSLTSKAQETFRNHIKRIELQSEKLQQQYLEALEIDAEMAPCGQAVEENLEIYARDLGIEQ